MSSSWVAPITPRHSTVFFLQSTQRRTRRRFWRRPWRWGPQGWFWRRAWR
uniref:Uncharacterized protein n=1 Tax=Timema shepardi TaxID=629360 RepID=A0A7R9B9F0_TIMSH|nr:unnamed protein product [Timema shepardi]